MRSAAVCALGAALLSTFVAATTSPKYYIEVKTARQGEIYNSDNDNWEGTGGPPINSTPALSFHFTGSHQISSGVTGSGATGAPTYSTVSVAKSVDSGTALLMQALITAEILETVTLTAIETVAGGTVTMTYNIVNGQFITIEHKGSDTALVEYIAIHFQKMEIDVTTSSDNSTTSAELTL